MHLNKNNYKYYADYKKKSKKSYFLLKIDYILLLDAKTVNLRDITLKKSNIQCFMYMNSHFFCFLYNFLAFFN